MSRSSATVRAALAVKRDLDAGGFRAVLERHYTIRDKNAELRRIVLNPMQLDALSKIEAQWRERGSVRAITLKARQIGFSTLYEGVAMAVALTNANTRSLVISHLDEHAEYLYGMLDRGLQNLEAGGVKKVEVVREAERYRMDGITLRRPMLSEIATATARNVHSGRGATTQFLHASEAAFYPDAGTLMSALLPAMPMSGSWVLVESTANGLGNWFADTWEAAVEGRNDFLPLFYGWWQHYEYTKVFESEKQEREFVASMGAEEHEIRDAYGLTLEQLNWRRWAINNLCDGDATKFRVEFPACPEEAFVASGRPAFDPLKMARIVRNCATAHPSRRGYLQWQE